MDTPCVCIVPHYCKETVEMLVHVSYVMVMDGWEMWATSFHFTDSCM